MPETSQLDTHNYDRMSRKQLVARCRQLEADATYDRRELLAATALLNDAKPKCGCEWGAIPPNIGCEIHSSRTGGGQDG